MEGSSLTPFDIIVNPIFDTAFDGIGAGFGLTSASDTFTLKLILVRSLNGK